jgi:hypothetical protein
VVTVFDTETMAELCVKQGLHERAIEIYRRLADDAADRAARARYEARIAALSGPARRASSGAASLPGLRVDRRGDELDIAWQLPRGTPTPTLQCLLLKRTPGGIEAEPRTLALQTPQGELKLVVPNLHSARVAAGRLEGERFVPIARLPMPL